MDPYFYRNANKQKPHNKLRAIEAFQERNSVTVDEQLKDALLHKTMNERTSSEAGASSAILKQLEITRVAPSNFFSKDNVNCQPQTQRKGRPSIIDSGDGNRTMHGVD